MPMRAVVCASVAAFAAAISNDVHVSAHGGMVRKESGLEIHEDKPMEKKKAKSTVIDNQVMPNFLDGSFEECTFQIVAGQQDPSNTLAEPIEQVPAGWEGQGKVVLVPSGNEKYARGVTSAPGATGGVMLALVKTSPAENSIQQTVKNFKGGRRYMMSLSATGNPTSGGAADGMGYDGNCHKCVAFDLIINGAQSEMAGAGTDGNPDFRNGELSDVPHWIQESFIFHPANDGDVTFKILNRSPQPWSEEVPRTVLLDGLNIEECVCELNNGPGASEPCPATAAALGECYDSCEHKPCIACAAGDPTQMAPKHCLLAKEAPNPAMSPPATL